MIHEPVGDRELLTFRRGYYDLLVSLLWREPSPELIGALRQGIEERMEGARHLHPLLAEGWEEVKAYLVSVPAEQLGEAVRDEYTRLFLGPHDLEINPYECYYLTGRLWDSPLAVVRQSLREIGLEKEPGYPEPEDFLAFELEVVHRLIARQADAQDREDERRWVDCQATFLKRHLLVWASAAARDLGRAKSAAFYRGVAKLLQGFLELERELFKGWGPEEPRSLDDARQSFARGKEWKGPLFDLSGESGPGKEGAEL
jgi:TorA maturation chaperone TorD